MRFDRIAVVILTVSLPVGIAGVCLAQEAGFVDLTEVAARTELRHPKPTREVNEARGGSENDDLFNCHYSASNNTAFRTALVSLDRSYYQVGDEPKFEVTVENLQAVPLRFPFSPHLADLQPKNPAQKFSYSELQVELWIASGKEQTWSANTGGGFSLYGDDHHAGTMLTLKQGEWVRIVGKGKFWLPTDEPVRTFIRSGQAVDSAYADVSFLRAETLLTANATARVRRKLCIGQTRGRSIPIVLIDPQQ